MKRILAAVTMLLLLDLSKTIELQSSTFTPIIISGEYGKEYSLIINSTLEYTFLYSINNISLTDNVKIEVEGNATHDTSLLLIVREKKEILSWSNPLLVDNTKFTPLWFNKTSRSLCPRKYYRNEIENGEEFITVSVSTAVGGDTNIFFKLKMTLMSDFYLRPGEKRVVEISPSEPIFYGYTFPGQVESSSVIIHVESDNDICMTVSVQNTSCPVYNLENNVIFSGYWQTVSRQGGITVPRENYPSGFFVALTVKNDDTDCDGVPNMLLPRSKTVTLTINASITKEDYILASALTMSIIFGFCISYIVGVVVNKIKEGRKLRNVEDNECMQSPLTIEEAGPSQCASVEENSSSNEDDIDMMEDALTDKNVIRTKQVLSVCDLAHKDPKILRHKSRLYLYYLLTIAVFYALPVMQLVLTNQHVLHITGNQDLCYYNFLCSHPFGLLSDFNHVFSNIGYIFLGLLFILLTYVRENNELDKERNKFYGIPQHYGLFYAMGTALIMEGILSGSYHVCPNHTNFQFDTSFMYIIAVLCMIKIYQTRHPDISARAPMTFGVLALIIFIGLIGVLNGSEYFWAIFTTLHLIICLLLTIQIYYMGRLKFNRGLFRRIVQTIRHDARHGILNLLRPLYPIRFSMLIVGNLCNVGLAVFGNIRHETNFATFLLAILMCNLILYTFFYIIMKICHNERIMLQPLIYIILSMVLWGSALYFFINKTISWGLSPAQSRLYNKPCKLFNFFDDHDIWHFLSALAMFFSFMVLLTLDDDLIDVHRSQMPVF